MNYWLKAFSLLLLMATIGMPTTAQVKDTVFMNNGQVLIGELKSIALGKISFDADDITVLSLKATKIKTIKAISHLYKLETIHYDIYYTLLQPGSKGTVLVNMGDSVRELPIMEISSLTPLRSKTGVSWQGKVSAGYSFNRSSDIGQFNADVSVGYMSRKFDVLSYGSVIMTQTDTAFDVTNADNGFIGGYLLTPVWQAMALVNYQRNLELGLSRRFQEGVAMGLSVISTVHVRMKAITGVVFNQEKNTEGVETPTQVEIPLIVLFDFFSFKKPDMTLSFTQRFFASLTQKGRFRHDGNITITVKVVTDFSINLKLYDNFDNQPPGVNAAKFDYGTSFGLSYKFSQ
jgi:hypothetical protein